MKWPVFKLIIFFMVLLGIVTIVEVSLAYSEQESLPLYAYKALEDKSIVDIVALNNTAFISLGREVGGSPVVTVNLLDNGSLKVYQTSILLSSEPVKACFDGKEYVAVATRNGVLGLVDLKRILIQNLFGIPGEITQAFFMKNLLALLSTLSREEGINSVYILTPGQIKWGEARPIVGTLLEIRKEGLNPLQLVPVAEGYNGGYIYNEALILYARKPIGRYVLEASIVIAKYPNMTPASRAHVYVYSPTGKLLGEGAADERGFVRVPVDEPVQLFTLYIKTIEPTEGVGFVEKCYQVQVPREKVQVTGNTIIITGGIAVNEAMLVPACPEPVREYEMAFLKFADDNISLIPIDARIEAVRFQILWAHRLEDGYLVLVGGGGLSIGGLEYKRQGFAYLKIDGRRTAPGIVESKYYATVDGTIPLTASVSADSKIFAVGTSNGVVYVAGKTKPRSSGYELLWAYKLEGSIQGIRILGLAEDTYLIVAYTSNSFNIYALNLTSKTIKPLLEPNKGVVVLTGGEAISDVEFLGRTSIAIATSNGVYIIRNPAGLLYMSNTSLDDILVKSVKVNVVDEYGRSISHYNLSYSLAYKGAVIDKQTITSSDTSNTMRVPCLKDAVLTLTLAPQDIIYTPVTENLSCNEILGNNSLTIKVPVRNFTVNIIFADKEIGQPPSTTLNVTLRNIYTNETLEFSVPVSNGRGFLSLTLKAGNYTVTVVDNSGTLYVENTSMLELRGNIEYEVSLTRKPITVIMTLNSDYKPDTLDSMLVEIVDPGTGRIVFSRRDRAPSLDNPTVVQFETTYRGNAILRISFEPPRRDMMPYYSEVNTTIKLYNVFELTSITLEPRKYLLEAVIVAEEGMPVNASITIVAANGSRVGLFTGSHIRLNVLRGIYTLVVDPLSLNKTSIRLYETKTIRVEVYKDTSVKIELKKIREFVTIILSDPYAPQKGIGDNITVYIDGMQYTELPASKEQVPVKIPVLSNGSMILIKSRKVYKEIQRVIRPQDNGTLINLERKAYNLKLMVANDEGQGIMGASVTVRGVDNVYTSSVITGADGVASLALPYGAYTIQVEASGYEPYQVNILLESDTSRSIVLKPTILTMLGRHMNIVVAVILIVIIVVIIRTYFKRLLERLATEEEF